MKLSLQEFLTYQPNQPLIQQRYFRGGLTRNSCHTTQYLNQSAPPLPKIVKACNERPADAKHRHLSLKRLAEAGATEKKKIKNFTKTNQPLSIKS
jgi:hypothetical protein